MVTKDNIGQLMEFGALTAYEVVEFMPLTWSTEVRHRTFNEDYAKQLVRDINTRGGVAGLREHQVRFDIP